MTPDERIKLIKDISFEIGMCGSVKPERQAVLVVKMLERKYEMKEKEL